jgi:hypothetical protein
MAQGSSVFDASAFLEMQHDLKDVPLDWKLPDIGDYPAQIAAPDGREPITAACGEKDGRVWCNLNITWRITDENVAKKLNMSDIYVRQSVFMDLLDGSSVAAPRLDLGQNKSQGYKELIKATGLAKSNGKLAPSALKFATATIHVDHRRPDGFDRDVAEVTRVAPMRAG